jgi:hypothetical protein
MEFALDDAKLPGGGAGARIIGETRRRCAQAGLKGWAARQNEWESATFE